MKKVFLMLAVVAMASCSKSELSERPVSDENVEIKMGSTVLGIESRTPYVGETSTLSANNLTARVLASKEEGKYLSSETTSFWGDREITFKDATATGFNTPLYYPADATTPVHLFGLYPHTGWTPDPTDGRTATHAIDGCSDLMTAATATTKKADVQGETKTYPTLSFKHHLTKFDIEVKAQEIIPEGGTSDEGQAAIDAWGAITKIELVNWKIGANTTVPSNSCKVTFSDNTPDFTGSTGVIRFYGASKTGETKNYTDVKVGEAATDGGTATKITLTKDATLAAYAMVAPVNLTSGSDRAILKVYTEKLTDGKEVPVKLIESTDTPIMGLDKMAGKEFTITLTFTATEMMVKGEVTGWTAGGSGDETIN